MSESVLIKRIIIVCIVTITTLSIIRGVDGHESSNKWAPENDPRITCLRLQFEIEHLLNKDAKLGEKYKVLSKKLRERLDNRTCACDGFINTDGSVSGLRVFKGSGLADVDQRAINLVKETAPFKTKLAQVDHYVFYFGPLVHVRKYKDATSIIQGVP